MHSSSRGSSEAEGSYWAGPWLSTSQALYWGVYGALCCQRSALPSPSSIILGSRAAITAQTGVQSQPSRKLYRRWREKQRGGKKQRIRLFLLLPVSSLIWLASSVPSGCMTTLADRPVSYLIRSWTERLSHESTYNHVKIIIVVGIWQQ